jgi:hypothetical protein
MYEPFDKLIKNITKNIREETDITNHDHNLKEIKKEVPNLKQKDIEIIAGNRQYVARVTRQINDREELVAEKAKRPPSYHAERLKESKRNIAPRGNEI